MCVLSQPLYICLFVCLKTVSYSSGWLHIRPKIALPLLPESSDYKYISPLPVLGSQTQGFLHARGALYQQSYIPCPGIELLTLLPASSSGIIDSISIPYFVFVRLSFM